MSEKKVALADIARAAGMSKTAVSYALRDDPNIRRETRLRIQEVARKLGYHPDPLLSKLMSHLHEGSAKRRGLSRAGDLAYVAGMIPTLKILPVITGLTAWRRAWSSNHPRMEWMERSGLHHKPGNAPVRLGFVNSLEIVAVPEPGAMALLIPDLGVLYFSRRRRVR